MNSRLKSKVKKLARQKGIDLIGVAPIDRFREAPNELSLLGHPS